MPAQTRALMTSAARRTAGANWRVVPDSLLRALNATRSVPKKCCSVAGSRRWRRCGRMGGRGTAGWRAAAPRGDGGGRVEERQPGRIRRGGRVAVRVGQRIAVIGRQKFQRHFSFQQPIAASAAAMFVIANIRALSAMRCAGRRRACERCGPKREGVVLPPDRASVWSGGARRAVQRAERLDLVEVPGPGGAGQRGGPAVRKASALGTANGLSSPTQGAVLGERAAASGATGPARCRPPRPRCRKRRRRAARRSSRRRPPRRRRSRRASRGRPGWRPGRSRTAPAASRPAPGRARRAPRTRRSATAASTDSPPRVRGASRYGSYGVPAMALTAS